MKIKVKYPTKERKYITKHVYQNVPKDAELKVLVVFRSPCGKHGMAANRYYYEAECQAPEDAEFSYNGRIRLNINRSLNKKFDPKKLTWDGNTCIIP